MDLPPAASASPPAAFLLPPSTSTSAGHNDSSLANSVGQLGPSSQSAAVRSSSSVRSPPTPQGVNSPTERCAHKEIVRCSLLRGNCCSCADERAHEQYYERYVDGIGTVLDAPRWAHYCSCCREHWDRLNARIPPYRDNQPRITAWDLFHLATPPNVPPSAPNLTLSESARHSLTPSAQAAILTPEDDFPQSYAIFRLMSPNFSNEYHPVVAEHIRAWGELENRIANEPRYSPSFYTLLAQYHNARYKAKRMTELDRQSRGAGLSVQGADEYFHLLSNPGPFDVPSTSNVTSPGVGGNVRGAGSSSAAFGNPNLAHIGTSLSRVASLGNFLSSGPGSGGVGSREGDAVPTLASTGDNRASVSNISRASSTTATPPSRGSPSRRDLRRGNSPFEDSARTHANQTQQQEPSISATRPSAVDREREQDRDRETGRITAGTSSNAAGATASESLPSSSLQSPLQISSHPRHRPQSLGRTVTSFHSQRSRGIASVTSDIETDLTVADRRRQLRERNESEWENQRPASTTSINDAIANRTNGDSTIIDAIMNDLPSSQSSDSSNGSGNISSDGTVGSTTEPTAQNSLRHRSYFATSSTSEPWHSSQLPGVSNRNMSNDSASPTAGPSRRDIPNNFSTGHSFASFSETPIAAGTSSVASGFIFPTNRRSFRPTPPEQPPSSLASMPSSESPSRHEIVSPINRLSAPTSFLPSLPHLPAPRFSPTRNPTRSRTSSLSNNNASSHSRQSSNGSDNFPTSLPPRRRDRMNPLVHALGPRGEVEREDYENPLRTISRFAQEYEEFQRAEEVRRQSREMEAHREFLQSQDASTTETNMRRLQEHRNHQYELLQRASLQRQIDQLQAQNRLPGNGGNGPALGNWFSSGWPASSHHHSNAGIRSPEAGPAHAFGMPPEDEPSSNSDDDYEDMIPMEEDGFYNVTDNFIPRLSGNDEQPSTSRRASRLRRQYGHTPDELSRAPGLSGPPHGPNRNSVAEIQSRMERSRRFREREADLIRSRHTEAIRDIASLVGGVMPNRWNREHSSNGGSNGGRNGTNVSQAPRTLDHPQRPDIMKDEDMKIMADCKVCYGQIADIVLLPCAHLVLCQWCADSVAPAAPGRLEGAVAPRSNCPVCRARVDNKIKVFRC